MDILIPHRKTTKQMMHQINGLNNPILIMQISLIQYDHNKGCYQPRIGQQISERTLHRLGIFHEISRFHLNHKTM